MKQSVGTRKTKVSAEDGRDYLLASTRKLFERAVDYLEDLARTEETIPRLTREFLEDTILFQLAHQPIRRTILDIQPLSRGIHI